MAKPTLLLVYETEAACRSRLIAEGFSEQSAFEIGSYLAQSTDLAAEFDAIAHACDARGLSFFPLELDRLVTALPSLDPGHTLVWTLTDGIAYFRGSVAPGLARLGGFEVFGAEDALFALCQDKFRSGAVLRTLGLPCPPAGLARDGVWLVPPPASDSGWFVKPNRLGAKIGIWTDSRCGDPQEALALSRRVYAAYRDDVVVQPYVSGRNARASYLAIEPGAGIETAGLAFVDSGGDFQTMRDSLALYGDTGAAARAEGSYCEPALESVAAALPDADRAVRQILQAMTAGLGLRDVFSADLRVEPDGAVHLIEFEVCPGLPCFDFRAYCRQQYGMDLAEAIAETAVRRLRR